MGCRGPDVFKTLHPHLFGGTEEKNGRCDSGDSNRPPSELKSPNSQPDIRGLSGKFPNVQNSPPLRRPSGAARQVLLSTNEFDELRRENRIALSCLVIVLCFFM